MGTPPAPLRGDAPGSTSIGEDFEETHQRRPTITETSIEDTGIATAKSYNIKSTRRIFVEDGFVPKDGKLGDQDRQNRSCGNSRGQVGSSSGSVIPRTAMGASRDHRSQELSARSASTAGPHSQPLAQGALELYCSYLQLQLHRTIMLGCDRKELNALLKILRTIYGLRIISPFDQVDFIDHFIICT